MGEVQFGYDGNDPEKDYNLLRVLTPPSETAIKGFSDLDLAHEKFPNSIAIKNNIKQFSVADILTQKDKHLCLDAKSGRYIVSGVANARFVLPTLLTEIGQLLPSQTLAVDLSAVSATADFTYTFAANLFFPNSPNRSQVLSKQVVFFDPDYTTFLALHHSLISLGKINTNCMVAKSIGTSRWELRLLGNLEPHLTSVLDFARKHKSFRTHDLVDAGYSNYLANVAGRTRELWEMGLIRRTQVESPLNKSGRREFRYTPYHPLLDLYPSYPVNLLLYPNKDSEFSPEFVKNNSAPT